jgi:hypothetical protein
MVKFTKQWRADEKMEYSEREMHSILRDVGRKDAKNREGTHLCSAVRAFSVFSM